MPHLLYLHCALPAAWASSLWPLAHFRGQNTWILHVCSLFWALSHPSPDSVVPRTSQQAYPAQAARRRHLPFVTLLAVTLLACWTTSPPPHCPRVQDYSRDLSLLDLGSSSLPLCFSATHTVQELSHATIFQLPPGVYQLDSVVCSAVRPSSSPTHHSS